MTTGFRFEEKGHKYYIGKARMASVTEIVSEVCGAMGYASEWHLNRGTQVHKAISLYVQGRLNEASVDERIKGKVEAAKRVISTFGLAPVNLVEQALYDVPLFLAGTLDYFSESAVLVDWKSSHSAQTEVQAGGYVVLLDRSGYQPKACAEAVLFDDGSYTWTSYKPDKCRKLFLAAYTIYRWRESNRKGGMSGERIGGT
jgi:hypothetical protein